MPRRRQLAAAVLLRELDRRPLLFALNASGTVYRGWLSAVASVRRYRSMRTVKVGKDHEAFVDDEDYELVAGYTWCLDQFPRLIYAVAKIKGRKVKMHRLIMQPGAGHHIDHIDCNGLNNQRGNLRICTISENAQNQRTRIVPKTSQYKGVSFDARRSAPGRSGRWRAQVGHHGCLFRRSFKTELEAARAYDDEAKKHFGAFARLNFS